MSGCVGRHGRIGPDGLGHRVAPLVLGVILGDGTRLEADQVVLATGGEVPAQLAALGVTVPDATPAAFVVFTEPLDVKVQTVLNTPRVAVRPVDTVAAWITTIWWSAPSTSGGPPGPAGVPSTATC